MHFDIQLFGALREAEPAARIALDAPAATIGELRGALAQAVAGRWPASAVALLPHCAFATEQSVLRDAQPVPADGRLALLPPVSGG